MVETRNVPIRFSESTIEEIERAKVILNLPNRSALVKVAVSSLLRYLREHGPDGMRVEFAAILKDLDGRTHRYEVEGSARAIAAESSATYGKQKRGGG